MCPSTASKETRHGTVVDVITSSEQSEPVPGVRFSATDTPKAVDGVEIAVFEGEAVLFDESTSMVHQLGAIAGAVWLSCDGVTDVATMIDALVELFRFDESELASGVYATLERFAEEGLLVGHDRRERATPTPEPTLAGDGTEILARPPDP